MEFGFITFGSMVEEWGLHRVFTTSLQRSTNLAEHRWIDRWMEIDGIEKEGTTLPQAALFVGRYSNVSYSPAGTQLSHRSGESRGEHCANHESVLGLATV